MGSSAADLEASLRRSMVKHRSPSEMLEPMDTGGFAISNQRS